MKPYKFSAIVPKELKEKWLVRKTQIIPVEMPARIVALDTFSNRLRGVVFIDSEVVETPSCRSAFKRRFVKGRTHGLADCVGKWARWPFELNQ